MNETLDLKAVVTWPQRLVSKTNLAGYLVFIGGTGVVDKT